MRSRRSHRPSADPSVPRTARRARRALAGLAVVAVASAAVGSDAGAQNIEELRARAERIAAELDRIETRASELNEEYLATTEELQGAQRRIEENRASVQDAERRMDEARRQARGYAVSAYIGAGRTPSTIGAQDVNEAVTSQVLIETLQGDQLQVADDLRAARLDLQDRTSELERASAELSARSERQAALRQELEAGVERQQQLLSGANAELSAAIRAEQERQAAEAERQAREAAERAERERRAAAEAQARAAAEAQAQARSRSTSTTAAPRRGAAAAAPAPSAPARTRPAPAPAPAPVAPPVVSAPNGGAAAAIAAGQSVLGTPYRWGGTSPATGFDCSGFTSWAWAQAGVRIPRTSRAQFAGTQRVPLDQLQPGDLVFFGSPIHHVGLYIGGGMMMHSPRTGDVAKISPIYRGFGSPVGAGRVR